MSPKEIREFHWERDTFKLSKTKNKKKKKKVVIYKEKSNFCFQAKKFKN